MKIGNYSSLIFCGKIGSGKSHASKILQGEGWTIVSAGGLIAKLCRNEGLETDRKTLQEYGKKLLSEKGERYFGALMLEQAKGIDKVVFDGIRPVGAIQEISERRKTRIVYIETELSTRERRAIERDKISHEEFERLENNNLENLVLDVKKMADVIISNDSTEDIFRQKIMGLIDD